MTCMLRSKYFEVLSQQQTLSVFEHLGLHIDRTFIWTGPLKGVRLLAKVTSLTVKTTLWHRHHTVITHDIYMA